jgi:hypothetical protein
MYEAVPICTSGCEHRRAHGTFVEVRYDVRQIFTVLGSRTNSEALDWVAEAHERGADAMRPLLGERTGVYIGRGIVRDASVNGYAISARAMYRDIPTFDPF